MGITEKKLADLLDTYMIHCNMGDARLASQVNQLLGQKSFLHRSTVRNWRTGFSKQVRYWQQLVAVAAVLHLNRRQLEELLYVAGLPTLCELQKDAEFQMEQLLARWLSQTTKADLEQRLFELEKKVACLLDREILYEARTHALEQRLKSLETRFEKLHPSTLPTHALPARPLNAHPLLGDNAMPVQGMAPPQAPPY